MQSNEDETSKRAWSTRARKNALGIGMGSFAAFSVLITLAPIGLTAWMFSGFAVAIYGGFLRRAIDGKLWPLAVGLIVILSVTQLGWGMILHEAARTVLDPTRFGEDRGFHVALFGTAIVFGCVLSIDRRQWLPLGLAICAAVVGSMLFALRPQWSPELSDYLAAWSVVPLHAALSWPLYRDAKRAVDALARDRARCFECGYDIRGITARCPECGRPIPQSSKG